jgi:hypothetical protein
LCCCNATNAGQLPFSTFLLFLCILTDLKVYSVRPIQQVKILDCFFFRGIKRGRGRPRKTIRETIRKDLEVNELDPNMVYDRTLWRNLIHVADPT